MHCLVFVGFFSLLMAGCLLSDNQTPVHPVEQTSTSFTSSTQTSTPKNIVTHVHTQDIRETPTIIITPTNAGKFSQGTFDIASSFLPIIDDFPTLATSTSSKPIWTSVLCYAYGVDCVWRVEEFGPSGSYRYYSLFESIINDQIVAVGTHEAYMALIEGNADIILVAREPSQDEINAALAQNVILDIQPVAIDAFVFIVNTQNPVDNLSLIDIQGIYSGRISNWNEVGGPDIAIRAYQREANSGSQVLMENLVMQDIPMIEAPDMIQYFMSGVYATLGSTPAKPAGDVAGLGYSVYFYARNLVDNDDIEFIGVDGVEPTYYTLSNKTYPLVSDVYVVIREDKLNADESILMLRDWLFSGDGQRVIIDSGYIPAQ
jgi:phosphate transport system substrate-binding protein